jgi:sugar lactone lactonase YvrE
MKNLRVAFSISAAVLLTIGRSDVHANPGDLYSGQLSHNEIDKFSPTGAETLFISGFFADALAFDSKGNLFVADTQAGKIVKVTPGGVATDFATIGNPMGLAFDASGNLFVSNATSGSTGSIIELTPAGASSTFVTGLSGPSGLAFDRNGNLFVSETTAGIISKFTPAKVKTTFASGLSSPEGLAFDSAGNLYETDFGSGNVFKFTPAKTKSAFASPPLNGLGPRNIAIDRNDNVFVANFTPQTIVKFTPAGGTPTTFASNANAGGLAFEPPTAQLTNISTRASVQTGSGVTIAGFIITGTDSKQVVVRGLGPTLTQFGVSGVLANPTLDLHNSSSSIVTNDDWKDTQQSAIQATGLAPPNDLESAILITLQPGNYTAILAGKNNTIGVGLVEVYDISAGVFAELTNVSTRGHVGSGDNVMIGGFIAGGGNGSIEIVVRGLGPTLTQFGVAGALSDPKLTLVDVNGNVVRSNNNWKDTQQAAIQATGLAPPNNVESALVVTVAAGNYTAILEDFNGGTGIGLVEIYKVP